MEGYFCLGLNNKIPCIAGRYGNITGQKDLPSACPNVCEPGKYSTMLGEQIESTCVHCPAGSYCTGIENTIDHTVQGQTLCPMGKWGNISLLPKNMEPPRKKRGYD